MKRDDRGRKARLVKRPYGPPASPFLQRYSTYCSLSDQPPPPLHRHSPLFSLFSRSSSPLGSVQARYLWGICPRGWNTQLPPIYTIPPLPRFATARLSRHFFPGSSQFFCPITSNENWSAEGESFFIDNREWLVRPFYLYWHDRSFGKRISPISLVSNTGEETRTCFSVSLYLYPLEISVYLRWVCLVDTKYLKFLSKGILVDVTIFKYYFKTWRKDFKELDYCGVQK